MFWWPTLLLATVAIAVFQDVLWRHRPTAVRYACSVAVLLVALVLTVGVRSETRQALGTVTGVLWDNQAPYFFFWDTTAINIDCEYPERQSFVPVLRAADWDAIRSPSQSGRVEVELTYRLESVLGIWDLSPVADTVNTKMVLEGSGASHRGGLLGRLRIPTTLVVGVAPLAYLAYVNRKNLFEIRAPTVPPAGA